MTRPSRSNARTRALAVLTAAATIAGGAALLGPGTSSASSHREAPYTSSDPNIDGTDLYAFNSPDGSDTTTLIANYIPFEDPAGGPNFFPFATDARYNINIDNNGDGVADTTFRWTFTDNDVRGTTDHGDTAKGTFLYNDGPVTSLDDPNLLFKQSYKLERIVNPTDPAKAVSTTILNNVPVPPDNVGTASIPDYIPLSKAAVEAGKVGSGTFNGLQAFAGQRNDPFFLDLRVFDLLYGGNLSETGFNTIKDKNVKTLALKVPKALLAGAGDVNANPVVGVWTTSERHGSRTLQGTNMAAGSPAVAGSNANDWVQVSRLGNPLVNEAVVPANLKDSFNRLPRPGAPAPDRGHLQDPEPERHPRWQGPPRPRRGVPHRHQGRQQPGHGQRQRW